MRENFDGDEAPLGLINPLVDALDARVKLYLDRQRRELKRELAADMEAWCAKRCGATGKCGPSHGDSPPVNVVALRPLGMQEAWYGPMLERLSRNECTLGDLAEEYHCNAERLAAELNAYAERHQAWTRGREPWQSVSS